MTWPVFANFVLATGGFFTGFIIAKKSSAFIESSIARKFIAIFNRNFLRPFAQTILHDARALYNVLL